MKGFPLLLLLFLVPPSSPADEDVRTWKYLPIRVALSVSKERVIRLPWSIERVGSEVADSKLKRTAIGPALYLRTDDPLSEPERLYVRSVAGELIVVDVRTVPQASGEMVVIRLPEPVLTPTSAVAGQEPGYVDLVRHAAQSIYAPERLRPRSDFIVKAKPRQVDHLYRGAALNVQPTGAWRSAEYLVSAYTLTNTLDHGLALNPHQIREKYLFAVFQHARLQPSGRSGDRTTLYLVTLNNPGLAFQ